MTPTIRLPQRSSDALDDTIRIPLTATYDWLYESLDARLRKLYRLGKERGWDAALDIDWSNTLPRSEYPSAQNWDNPFEGWSPYDRLSETDKVEYAWHQLAWRMSQFLHGEQGALMVAAQLACSAPSYDTKLIAASQAFDEARHVEVFGRYLREQVGVLYPINPHLRTLLDGFLAEPEWDVKLIGMQMIVESLAMAGFTVQRAMTRDPLLQQIIDRVMADEARHVAFGNLCLESSIADLPEAEVERRADAAFEACVLMRERLLPLAVFKNLGWNVEEARQIYLETGQFAQFRNVLFARVMPNLRRIGLITDRVAGRYEELGLLDYAKDQASDEINWSELEGNKPGLGVELLSVTRTSVR